jgi:ATP-dependent DNA helicase RecG
MNLTNLPLKSQDIQQLQQLNISTTLDLLYYFPRDYIFYKPAKISQVTIGETVTIIGKIKNHRIITASNNKLTIQTWTITNKSATTDINCTHFYNHPYYKSSKWRTEQNNLYRSSQLVAVCGQVKYNNYTRKKVIDATEVKIISTSTIKSSTPIQPIYPLSKNISFKLLQKAIKLGLETTNLIDPLPQTLKNRYHLISLKQALTQIHFPSDSQSLTAARQRLIFDEFFYLQLTLIQRRQEIHQIQRDALFTQRKLIEQFLNILPFKLTNSQHRVVDEILNDLAQPTQMNRLVQGDVGSGKTVVAVIAILAAIESGHQAVLMTPTEVLAEQHHCQISAWFDLLKIPVAILTSSTSSTMRQAIYQGLATGKIPLLIGTHAVIQSPVNFHNLGLVVIDEQHRFGVEQRISLQHKGINPHTLTMTATPIPRTLALTIYGDLEISQIDELPPGRKPIFTKVFSKTQRKEAYHLIWEQIMQGHQAYIILPLVNDSETMNLKSAVSEYHYLQETVFPQLRIGLLHGQMNSHQKQEALTRFRNCQTQILVATTVVEVGVDVPNATVILIENAERFGLSQLHQLRGRIGRGTAQSYCFLINCSSNYCTQQRLEVLEKSQDGFFIAEMDLNLRGQGEILGTNQSGISNFILADLTKDAEILEQARKAAKIVITKGNLLKTWNYIMAELERRSQHLLSNNTTLN